MKNMIRIRVRPRLPMRQHRVCLRTPKVLIRRPAAFVSQELMDASYFAGKYITLFVFFYSSLNFLYYRNLRQEEEDDD